MNRMDNMDDMDDMDSIDSADNVENTDTVVVVGAGPAGMMAAANPDYAAMAVAAGLDLSKLTMGNFWITNMIPVTIGNILGGMVFVGLPLYLIHRQKLKADEAK